MQRQGFFSEPQRQSITLNVGDFLDAVRRGDSKQIDEMLAAKRAGAYLSLSGWYDEKPLKILLAKGDFINAGKLIAAGAETVEKREVLVSDSDGYPYHKTQYHSVFNEICLYPRDIRDLVKGYLSYDSVLASELNSVSTPSLSGWSNEKRLKILLAKGDFINAGKLIAAGAETVEKREVWVSDNDDCYPYGSYQTQYDSVFNGICLYPWDIRDLVKGYLSYDSALASELNSVSTSSPKL